jgi:hypothetical protein
MQSMVWALFDRAVRISFICFFALFGAAAAAGSLPLPTEKTMLTVSGKIDVVNSAGAAKFDRAMLEGLGMVSFETTTPWYKGVVRFEGVPLSKLMAAVGASGNRITAISLDDYAIQIPMEDIKKYNVILALKRDGSYMPVSDKGPLFIVYPFDSDPELKSQKFYGRSAWQVARLEVE